MTTKKIFLIIAITSLWCSPLASASNINWSGFMTISAGKTLDYNTTYLIEPTTGAVYDNDFRFGPASLVGLQGQAVITDRLRATVQMVSKGGDEFNTNVDWAFMSYDLTNNLTLNAGRFRLPLYYYSDFMDVGYAYHWIRPPTEMYNAFTAGLEGVNLYHTTMLGDVELATQVWYGGIEATSDNDEFGQTRFEVLKNQGINTMATWNWLTVRLLYNTTDITTTMEDFGASEVDVRFLAAAFMIDYGNFIWRSEITQARNSTDYPASEWGPAGTIKTKDTTWYASAGYRVGDFTPHVTHTVVDPDEFGFGVNTTTNTVGVAWDFHPSAMFKVEYLKTEQEETMFVPGNKFGMFSTAINILF